MPLQVFQIETSDFPTVNFNYKVIIDVFLNAALIRIYNTFLGMVSQLLTAIGFIRIVFRSKFIVHSGTIHPLLFLTTNAHLFLEQ